MQDRVKVIEEILRVLERHNATAEDVKWLIRDLETTISHATTVEYDKALKIINLYVDDNL